MRSTYSRSGGQTISRGASIVVRCSSTNGSPLSMVATSSGAGLVEEEAEGVARRVEADAHVVLGLVRRELGTAGKCVLDSTLEIGDPDVEVHLDRRLARLARPDRALVVLVLLEGEPEVVVTVPEHHPSPVVVDDLPVEQPGVERTERA